MKYVFLAYPDQNLLEAMSPGARVVFEEACQANEQDLRRRGHLYATEDLQNNNAILTVQVVNGKLCFTDSPFVSTRGLSIRLFFIHARDLNVAIQIASNMPQAGGGMIEVRPIVEFKPGDIS